MSFEPENFRGGETGQNGVANLANRRRRAAEFGHDQFAFGGGRGVAPKFGRADDFAAFVQRHKPVLLAADADGRDFIRARLWPA